MSLFDSASLVVTPNGVKEGKLYSIKPTDGSGDLSVTRATTATRVNSAGLVELVPYNLATYSNTFSNADYIKTNVTLTANQAETPDTYGLSSLFVPAATVGNRYLARTIDNSSKLYSIFLKKKELSYVKLGTANSYVVVNLNNGTLSTSSDVYNNYSITNVGNEWYRVGVYNKTTSAQVQIFGGVSSTGTNVATNGTDGFYIYGFQLVDGSLEKPYFPTTDRLNIPRLDYSNGSCPSILVEPQRTNIQLNSADFSQSTWTKTKSAIVANDTTAPDGTLTADKLNETAVNGLHQLEASRSVSSSTSYTMSVYAKKGERNFLYLYEDTTGKGAFFNLNTGVVGTVSSSTTASIQDAGNGWYRCLVTYTESGIFGRYRIAVSNADNSSSYLGVAGSGIYIWGSQYEAGSYATSYIPTVASSVTRNADLTNKTGISSLIGQTEGTLYGEFRLQTATGGSAYLGLTSGSFSNFILLGKEAPNKLVFGIRANGSNIIFNSSTNLTSDYVKCAIAYKSGSWAAYLNGNLMFSGTNTFTFSAALNTLGFGSTGDFASLNDKIEIKSTALFKTRLTNEELAQLTTI